MKHQSICEILNKSVRSNIKYIVLRQSNIVKLFVIKLVWICYRWPCKWWFEILSSYQMFCQESRNVIPSCVNIRLQARLMPTELTPISMNRQQTIGSIKKLRFYKTFWYWYKWTKREQTFPTTKFLVVIWWRFWNKFWESSKQGVSLESLLQLTWDHNPSKSSLSINLWICVIMGFKKLYYRTWHSRWIRGPGEGPMSWAMSSKDQRKRRSWSWEPKYMAFGIIRFVFW